MTSNVEPPLAQLVRLVVAIRRSTPDTVRPALTALMRLAQTQVPTATYAGITVTARRADHSTPVITDHPGVALIDEIERRHGDGPARRAARRRQIVIVDDLRTDSRWPALSQGLPRGAVIRSIAALPVHLDELSLGALCLYADHPGAFSTADVATVMPYADLMATAWSAVVRETQLQQALRSRDVISQAKGVLRERNGISDEDAFTMLRRLSSITNTPLREVAERVLTPRPHPE